MEDCWVPGEEKLGHGGLKRVYVCRGDRLLWRYNQFRFQRAHSPPEFGGSGL